MSVVGKDAAPRPGVLRLVDEARDAGLKVAVCSAATKSSVIHVVKSLFGEARYEVRHIWQQYQSLHVCYSKSSSMLSSMFGLVALSQGQI